MKSALIFIGLMATIFAHAGTPEERIVPVEDVFAPMGFDSNDNVEIVVSGYLPNLCHKNPKAKVKVEDKKIKVTLTSLYYEENNPYCPEMAVPFTETLSLGLLKAGEYKIVVNEKSETTASEELYVDNASRATVDSHTYAYVDYIEQTGSGKVKLRGYHLSDCFELEKIAAFSNGKNVYSILPILKKVSNFCPRKMLPFSYEYTVPKDLNAKKVLLHVRTMNGNSVNSIFKPL